MARTGTMALWIVAAIGLIDVLIRVAEWIGRLFR